MEQTRPASAGEDAVMGRKNGCLNERGLIHNSIYYFVVKGGTNILQYQCQILALPTFMNEILLYSPGIM
jgi:hypothetical protein